MRRTLVPLAAVIVLAGCSDFPTVLAPEPSAVFEVRAPPEPSAEFVPKTACFLREAEPTVDCMFRLANFQNIPSKAQVHVQVVVEFEAGVVCVNKKGETQPAEQDSYTGRAWAEVWFRKLAEELAGQVTLTPSIPASYCPDRGWSPAIKRMRAERAGFGAEAVVRSGSTETRYPLARMLYEFPSE